MRRANTAEEGRFSLQSHHQMEDERFPNGRVTRQDQKPIVWLPPHLKQELTDAEKFLIARNCSEGFSTTKPNLLI